MTTKSEKAKQAEKRELNSLGDDQLDQVTGGIVVTKHVDKASPKLWLYAVGG